MWNAWTGTSPRHSWGRNPIRNISPLFNLCAVIGSLWWIFHTVIICVVSSVTLFGAPLTVNTLRLRQNGNHVCRRHFQIHFSWMKIVMIWFEFLRSLVLRIQLIICHHCFSNFFFFFFFFRLRLRQSLFNKNILAIRLSPNRQQAYLLCGPYWGCAARKSHFWSSNSEAP